MSSHVRYRVTLFISAHDFRHGLARASRMTNSKLQLAELMIEWVDRYQDEARHFILDFEENPKF